MILYKRGQKYWNFEDGGVFYTPSKFTINTISNDFYIVYENNLKSKKYNVTEVTLIDLVGSGTFTFANINNFMQKLEELNCPCFQQNSGGVDVSDGKNVIEDLGLQNYDNNVVINPFSPTTNINDTAQILYNNGVAYYVSNGVSWGFVRFISKSVIIEINEGNGIGYAIDNRISTNYGNIGLRAFDLSFSNFPSTENGSTGRQSFALGVNVIASGFMAIATGNETKATAQGSRAGGEYSEATGFLGVAEGARCKAPGYIANATGERTEANGSHANAHGLVTIASGNYSFAQGLGNFARGQSEHSGGQFGTDYVPNGQNDRLVNYGNGDNENNRSDAFTVLRNGKIIAYNTLRLRNYTVATLPAGTRGDTAYVTDAQNPTYLGILTGGGTTICPVFYNGSNWISH